MLDDAPWTQFRLEGIGSAFLAARGHDTLRLLRERGIVLPAGNRLEKAVKMLDEVNESPELLLKVATDPVFGQRLLESSRTVFEAFVIMWTAVERYRAIDPFPPDRLRYLLEGAELPSEDTNPKARNTQFELLVGASLILGGADIRPQEPDYALLYHGSYVGVAVKRLSSAKPSKVADQLRIAAGQIAATTGRGFVAVNLDSWIEDLSGNSPAEIGKQFNEQLREAHGQLAMAAEREVLLGALVFGTWAKWRTEDSPPSFQWQSPTQTIGFADEPADEQRFNDFFGPLRERWERSMSELCKLLGAQARIGRFP